MLAFIFTCQSCRFFVLRLQCDRHRCSRVPPLLLPTSSCFCVSSGCEMDAQCYTEERHNTGTLTANAETHTLWLIPKQHNTASNMPEQGQTPKTKPLFFLHDAAVRLTKKFGVLHSPLCSLASRVVSSCLAGNAAAVVASAFPWCCCRARRVSASLASTKYRYNVGESRPKCFFFEDELLYEQKVVFKSLLSRLQLQRDYHRVHLEHD